VDEIWDNAGNFRGYKPTAQALGRAEGLIHGANISPELRDWYMDFLHLNNADELTTLIKDLEQIQREPEDPAKQFVLRQKNQKNGT
jgi:hypothetical protein